MRLTERLKKIVDFIDYDDRVADIGTDHGYIPVYLIREKMMKDIIASDINELPLENARKYIEKANLEDRIDLRIGNGLEVLEKNEVDTVIIAGMGGILISEILDRDKELTESIDKFILQPMVGIEELLIYLEKNDYNIVDESLAKEGDKIYQIFKVKRASKEKRAIIEYEFSDALIEKNDIVFKEFLDKKIAKLGLIIESIKSNSDKIDQKYLKNLENKRNIFIGVRDKCFLKK
ncbi:MAG: class I SAM-dependent methyltransferase [Andreesenia angusta]|nr:class I SAM-dependent methyltransferase [Andreesenia angusta]